MEFPNFIENYIYTYYFNMEVGDFNHSILENSDEGEQRERVF